MESIKGNDAPAVVQAEFSVDNRIPITEQFIEISAIYDYVSGANTQTGAASLTVPISLQTYSYLVAPVKEADFKLTLEANSEIPPLNEVFSDFIEATAPEKDYYSNPNVLSFLLNEGSVCTLIVAKNSSSRP